MPPSIPPAPKPVICDELPGSSFASSRLCDFVQPPAEPAGNPSFEAVTISVRPELFTGVASPTVDRFRRAKVHERIPWLERILEEPPFVKNPCQAVDHRV